MNLIEYTFSGKKVKYFLDASIADLENIVQKERLIIITDDTVLKHHPELGNFKKIVIPSGEQHKRQSTVDYIIDQLLAMEADRKTFIVGIGGGVVTDIAGFAASIYMRGLSFGFVPTTILAQVDASIGGKNGIDTGLYKNMVGLIRQPEFVLFDHSLLQTLPLEQWINGFAEVIKHACIKDESMFALLSRYRLEDFMNNEPLLAMLIAQNVVIKSTVVANDEFETGERKLLNFGHTIGHAIENMYELPHGHAVSIGMVSACALSVKLNAFDVHSSEQVRQLLARYHLPTSLETDRKKVFEILKMDKKRGGDEMTFVLLSRIGQAVTRSIPLRQLETLIEEIK